MDPFFVPKSSDSFKMTSRLKCQKRVNLWKAPTTLPSSKLAPLDEVSDLVQIKSEIGIYKKAFQYIMGVRRLFSKKHLKTYYFPLKKSKNILFWPARGGQGPPLALPCGRPCNTYHSTKLKAMLLLTRNCVMK